MGNDAVLRLVNKPQSQWRKPELADAFLLLLQRHKEAMDGWGSALESCDAIIKTNRVLLELLQRDESLDTAATEKTLPIKPGRGRPKKHADLSWVDRWLEDSYRKFGHLNDRPLIRAAFAEMYERHGMRSSRLLSKETKSKMETFRQLLVERRYQLKQKKKGLSEK